MLNIYYGRMPEAIFNTAVYFKNVYEDSWITDFFAKEMILDVDKSVVLGEAVIDSPVLGKISPLGLSGGVKTLILIKLVSKKFVSFKKPMNPSKFQTHPAVLELFALCAIPAVSLKGRKNTSANNA